jgi:hypothetical protein
LLLSGPLLEDEDADPDWVDEEECDGYDDSDDDSCGLHLNDDALPGTLNEALDAPVLRHR